jgi:hypothetical protein
MKRPLPFHSNAVWPPPLMVTTFVLAYVFVSVCFWLIARTVPGGTTNEEVMEPLETFRLVFLDVAAAVYAAYRLWRFHPACNQAYANWLRLSPWTAAKPLPLGPVHPVWQDGAVLAALAALAYLSAPTGWVYPVIALVMIYLIGFTFLLLFTRQWAHGVALGFLWPSLLLPGVHETPAPALTVIAAMVVVIWHGHRRSLKAFPWEKSISPTGSILQAEIPSLAPTSNLGWAFSTLSPKIKLPSVSPKTNLAMGALAGWWTFCVISASREDPGPEWILFFAVLLALFRLIRYGAGTAPPFNIWGRFASGRLIIPGYDKIFLTPLATVLVAVLGVIVVKRYGSWYAGAESCLIAVVWWIVFGGGPTLRNWALTGEHRLTPMRSVGRANARTQLFRPV